MYRGQEVHEIFCEYWPIYDLAATNYGYKDFRDLRKTAGSYSPERVQKIFL